MNKKNILLLVIVYLISSISIASSKIVIDDRNPMKADPEVVQQLLMKPIIEEVNQEKQGTSATQTIEKMTSENNEVVGKKQKYSIPKEVTMQSIGSSEDIQSVIIKKGAYREKPSIRKAPSNVTYKLNGINTISSTGINAITSPVKITGFVPEPGVVSYVWINNGYGVAFQLKEPQKNFQAVITFESKKPPLSVFFEVSNIPGRVIALPSSLTGTSPLKLESNSKSSNEDEIVINLMSQVINEKPFDSAWQYDEKFEIESPYHEFLVERYQHWYNEVYSIKAFRLCSTQRKKLLLNEVTFSKENTIGITLTKHNLHRGECAKLVVISVQTQQPSSEEHTKFAPKKGN